MEINLDSLIPYEEIMNEPENVFQLVEINGKAVLIKDNKPAYIILKYSDSFKSIIELADVHKKKYKLQEAMKIVLLGVEDYTMHAAELADEIYRQRLYLKKDGGKAQYNQIRARCGHYTNLFETLPGNIIKLKDGVTERK